MTSVLDSIAFWRTTAVVLYFLGILIAGIMVIETWESVPKARRTALRAVFHHVARPIGWPVLIVGGIAWALLKRIGIVAAGGGYEAGKLVELKIGRLRAENGEPLTFAVRVLDDGSTYLAVRETTLGIDIEVDLTADEADELVDALDGAQP